MTGLADPPYTEVHRTTIDGVPIFWASMPPPLMAAMVFRVGRADETFVTGGITHFVEHLAMFSLGPLALAHNAFVDLVRSTFHARGDPQDVARFLRDTALALHRLPVERLESERRVLITEADRRPRNPVAALLSARFGAKGPGLADYRELGLLSLPGAALEAWAAERFTRDNCAIWMTGPPPEDLVLDLPAGTRFPSPAVDPIAKIALPAVRGANYAGVALGYLCARTPADRQAADLVAMSLTDRLRRQDALIYDLMYDYQPLSATAAHVAFGAASLETNVEAVLTAMLEHLATFRTAGPPAEFTEQRLSMIRQAIADPNGVPGVLDADALCELMGFPHQSQETFLADQSGVTPEASAASLSAGLDQSILIAPRGSHRPAGFNPYPDGGALPVNGRSFARWADLYADTPKGSPTPSVDRLVLGGKGISRSWEGVSRWSIAVRFADCVGVVATGVGALVIQGDDDTAIEVMTAELVEGDDFIARLRAAVSEDLFVPDRDVDRWRSMDALARERFGSRSSAWLDLQTLAGRLEPDERVEEIAMGSSDGRPGVLALTDRRLIWVRHRRGSPNDGFVEVTRREVTQAKAGRRAFGVVLAVTHRGKAESSFRGVTPPSAANAIAEALARRPGG
jgi:zinc protease